MATKLIPTGAWDRDSFVRFDMQNCRCSATYS